MANGEVEWNAKSSELDRKLKLFANDLRLRERPRWRRINYVLLHAILLSTLLLVVVNAMYLISPAEWNGLRRTGCWVRGSAPILCYGVQMALMVVRCRLVMVVNRREADITAVLSVLLTAGALILWPIIATFERGECRYPAWSKPVQAMVIVMVLGMTTWLVHRFARVRHLLSNKVLNMGERTSRNNLSRNNSRRQQQQQQHERVSRITDDRKSDATASKADHDDDRHSQSQKRDTSTSNTAGSQVEQTAASAERPQPSAMDECWSYVTLYVAKLAKQWRRRETKTTEIVAFGTTASVLFAVLWFALTAFFGVSKRWLTIVWISNGVVVFLFSHTLLSRARKQLRRNQPAWRPKRKRKHANTSSSPNTPRRRSPRTPRSRQRQLPRLNTLSTGDTLGVALGTTSSPRRGEAFQGPASNPMRTAMLQHRLQMSANSNNNSNGSNGSPVSAPGASSSSVTTKQTQVELLPIRLNSTSGLQSISVSANGRATSTGTVTLNVPSSDDEVDDRRD
eukprot:TRINITY_DN63011_c0_g1_i1.p1 TRINITY_DN63011_c0_g1~~TRINITY_DN63011_c0_g1_i1.p1  ORF type:complete len:510 (-),score=195.10 TRINITY_DN63011_c0_g1_i1:129-1658(-)